MYAIGRLDSYIIVVLYYDHQLYNLNVYYIYCTVKDILPAIAY